MEGFSKNLVLFFKNGLMHGTAGEQELQSLEKTISTVFTPENFCAVHELVNRNRITTRSKKILKASRHYYLPPFRFLINKN